MPKSIHKLDTPDLSAAFLGIACAEPIQRFSWLINRNIGADFSFLDISQSSAQNILQPFATFHFVVEESEHHLLLIATRSGEKNLLPDMKNLDYLLACTGSESSAFITDWAGLIKKIPGVMGCFMLSPEKGVLKKLAALLVK
jgi:hypothetical protein